MKKSPQKVASKTPTPLRDHWLDYVILLCGGSLLLVGVWGMAGTTQVIFSISLGVFYTMWGIWHHARHAALTAQTILEYATFGMLVSVVLLFLL